MSVIFMLQKLQAPLPRVAIDLAAKKKGSRRQCTVSGLRLNLKLMLDEFAPGSGRATNVGWLYANFQRAGDTARDDRQPPRWKERAGRQATFFFFSNA